MKVMRSAFGYALAAAAIASADPFLTFTKPGDPSVSMRIAPFITTHWNGTAPELGTGQIADRRMDNHEKDGQPFNDALRPSFNNYSQQLTVGTDVRIASTADDQLSFSIAGASPSLTNVGNGVADDIDRYLNAYWSTV